MLITILESKITYLHDFGISDSDIDEITRILDVIKKDISTNNLVSAVAEIPVLKMKISRLYAMGVPDVFTRELLDTADAMKMEILENNKIPSVVNITNSHLKYAQYAKDNFDLLVVDDSEDCRNWTKVALKPLPFTIDMAENGAVAVGKYQEHKYDVIIMDVQMPIMNGYMATSLIREWEEEHKLPKIPIIALTANSFVGARERSFDVGCNEHLEKPIKQSVLIETIMKHIYFSKYSTQSPW